jgi:TonB family protein
MRRIFLLSLLLAAVSLNAQSTQAELETRLLQKPLYLRGLWRNDKLQFDQAGVIQGKSLPMSFTLAGIEITRVRLKPNELLLDGRRVGLTFKGNTPQRVVLRTENLSSHDEAIHLEIAGSPSADYSAALDAILTTDLAELIPLMPIQWRKFAIEAFAPTLANPGVEVVKANRSVKKDSGGVTAPRVLYAPEPHFTTYAKAMKMSGNCLVSLQIDTEGKPVNVSILRPIGLGLDEQAIVAVSQYRFKPAMENGEPVIVEMKVEVNFQIF